jgi:hypothetical protein
MLRVGTRCRTGILAVAVLLAPARGALADPQSSERTVLNREGLSLAEAGRWAEALERFQRVITMRPTPKGWFNLARAEEHVGRAASAERDYGKALDAAKAAGERDVADAAESAIRDLALKVAHVRLHLVGRSPARGARVELDGQPIPLDASVSVDAGDHDVVLHAEGMPDVAKHVRVADRDQVDVALEPAAPPSDGSRPAPVSPPAPEGERRSFVGPVVVASLGVIAATAGVAIYFTGKSSYDSAYNQCPGGCPDQTVADRGNGGRTSMIAGDACLAVGGALAAAGVGWLVLGRQRSAVPVTVGFWGTAADLRGRF